MSLLAKFRALFAASTLRLVITAENIPSEELFAKLEQACVGYPEVAVMNAMTNLLAAQARTMGVPRKTLLWEVGAAWHAWAS